MARPDYAELLNDERIPVLYEDRVVLALDKPRGWLLAPDDWQRTQRNLQAALVSAIAAGLHWSRSRNLKFLRYVHRLDADTSGVLLFVKSPGALRSFSQLFESRAMEKTYLAVVSGKPKQTDWVSAEKLAPDPRQPGRMRVDARLGKAAETHFRLLDSRTTRRGEVVSLLEAAPLTGRTHQLRVHLAAAGHPIVGDELYHPQPSTVALGLRAVRLAYHCPFMRRAVHIEAPVENFLKEYGFHAPAAPERGQPPGHESVV